MQFRGGSWQARAIAAAITGFGGMIFLVVGFAIRDSGDPLEGGVLVDGQVVATPSSDSDGDTCTKVVRYFVDGVAYEARSSVGTSSGCGDIGGTMQVSYRPEAPQTARVIDSQAGWFGLVFQVLGGGLLAVCAFLIVRLVRHATSADTSATGAPGTSQPAGRLSDLTFSGPPPGAGSAGGSPTATVVTPPPLPLPAVAPPPGWYLDTDDPGGAAHQRWWDGRAWTDHRR